MPAPGVRVGLSPEYNPPILKGIKVHPDNPFRFDFILDQGDSVIASEAKLQLKQEASKLIKYFLASLTIPEKDLWVNLSPYEKNRIVPESFGRTEMGRDLLAEDYMLKQITASLIYPEDEIGKKFWKRIYEEAAKKFGTTNIPVNTFNKVWIVPEKAAVYENAKAGTAYVIESKLKVMLEQDYLALQKNTVIPAKAGPHTGHSQELGIQDTSALGSQIVREIVIPELTKEVNEDKNFSQLRQVYNSLILATWYKKKIKDSILSQVYADKNKVAGVNINDPQEKQRIYERYLQAFKKGAYNYIKEEIDPVTQETVPRKYFSGGESFTDLEMGQAMTVTKNWNDSAMTGTNEVLITARFDNAMVQKQREVTSWAEAEKEGFIYKIEGDARTKIVRLYFKGKWLSSGIQLDISHEQQIVYVSFFYPNFPRDGVKGRRRALLSELFRVLGLDGYYFMGDFNKETRESLKGMEDLQGDAREVQHILGQKIRGISNGFLMKYMEKAFGASNLFGQIRMAPEPGNKTSSQLAEADQAMGIEIAKISLKYFPDNFKFQAVDGEKPVEFKWYDADFVFNKLLAIVEQQEKNTVYQEILKKLNMERPHFGAPEMHWVVRELQKNAARAIEDSGKKEGHVDVGLSIDHDRLILSISDDGKGLAAVDPAKNLDQIKEWIFRDGTSTKDSEDEAFMEVGQGLYSIRRDLKWMFGKGAEIIALDNKLDLGLNKAGATFRITIPLGITITITQMRTIEMIRDVYEKKYAALAERMAFPGLRGVPNFTQAGYFTPTGIEVAAQLLAMAGVGKQTVFVDAGGGDGRMALVASRVFGAQGTSIEQNRDLVRLAKEMADKLGESKKVKLIQGWIKDYDFSKADVVYYTYNEPYDIKTHDEDHVALALESNFKRFEQQIIRQLRPGAVVVLTFGPQDLKFDSRFFEEFAPSFLPSNISIHPRFFRRKPIVAEAGKGDSAQLVRADRMMRAEDQAMSSDEVKLYLQGLYNKLRDRINALIDANKTDLFNQLESMIKYNASREGAWTIQILAERQDRLRFLKLFLMGVQSQYRFVRQASIKAAEKFDDSRYNEVLMIAVKDSYTPNVMQALDILEKLGKEEDIYELLRIAEGLPEEEVFYIYDDHSSMVAYTRPSKEDNVTTQALTLKSTVTLHNFIKEKIIEDVSSIKNRWIEMRRSQKIVMSDVKDQLFKDFMAWLKENNLEDIVVFGGGVRDILTGRPLSDFDITVAVPLTDEEYTQFLSTRSQANKRVVLYVRDRLKALAKALGVPVENFFDSTKQVFWHGREIQYSGPFEKRDEKGQPVYIKRAAADSRSLGLFTSVSTPSILQMAVDANGQLYGHVEAIKDLNDKTIRIIGNIEHINIGTVMRIVRLQCELGFQLIEHDKQAIRRIVKDYTDKGLYKFDTYLKDVVIIKQLNSIAQIVRAKRSLIDPLAELQELGMVELIRDHLGIDLDKFFDSAMLARDGISNGQRSSQLIQTDRAMAGHGQAMTTQDAEFSNGLQMLEDDSLPIDERAGILERLWKKYSPYGYENMPASLPRKIVLHLGHRENILAPFLKAGKVSSKLMRTLSYSVHLTRPEKDFLWPIFHEEYPEHSNRSNYLLGGRIDKMLLERRGQGINKISVLDVGCGPVGAALQKLKKEYGEKVDTFGIGFDIQAAQPAEGVKLYEGDAEDMSVFKNGSFDVVNENFVSGYWLRLDDFVNAVNEIMRVVKKDGVFILMYWNENYSNKDILGIIFGELGYEVQIKQDGHLAPFYVYKRSYRDPGKDKSALLLSIETKLRKYVKDNNRPMLPTWQISQLDSGPVTNPAMTATDAAMSVASEHGAVKISIEGELQHHAELADRIGKVANDVLEHDAIPKGVSWSGRSIIIPLSQEERFTVNGKTFKSIRLKGTTYDEKAPVMLPYYKTNGGVGVGQSDVDFYINDENRIIYKKKEPSPQGTLYLADAKEEFKITKALYEAGIPTAMPMGWGEFTGLSFEGKKVGFIIFAEKSNPVPLRVSEVFRKLVDDRKIGNYYTDLHKTVKAAAKVLRSVNNMGIIHVNPHFQQFSWQNNSVMNLYDFESVFSARDPKITKNEFIYRFLRSFYRFYDSVNSMALMFDDNMDKKILSSRFVKPIFEEALKGYLPENEMQGILQGFDPTELWGVMENNLSRIRTENKTLDEVLEALTKNIVLAKVVENAGKIYEGKKKSPDTAMMSAKTIKEVGHIQLLRPWGNVFKGLLRGSNQAVIVKTVDLNRGDIKSRLLVREEDVLTDIRQHWPSLVKYIPQVIGYGTFQPEDLERFPSDAHRPAAGTFYIIEAKINDETLGQYVARVSSDTEVLDALILVAKALKEMNSAGIYHRDLSSVEIFLPIDGSVKFIDFEVAETPSIPLTEDMRYYQKNYMNIILDSSWSDTSLLRELSHFIVTAKSLVYDVAKGASRKGNSAKLQKAGEFFEYFKQNKHVTQDIRQKLTWDYVIASLEKIRNGEIGDSAQLSVQQQPGDRAMKTGDVAMAGDSSNDGIDHELEILAKYDVDPRLLPLSRESTGTHMSRGLSKFMSAMFNAALLKAQGSNDNEAVNVINKWRRKQFAFLYGNLVQDQRTGKVGIIIGTTGIGKTPLSSILNTRRFNVLANDTIALFFDSGHRLMCLGNLKNEKYKDLYNSFNIHGVKKLLPVNFLVYLRDVREPSERTPRGFVEVVGTLGVNVQYRENYIKALDQLPHLIFDENFYSSESDGIYHLRAAAGKIIKWLEEQDQAMQVNGSINGGIDLSKVNVDPRFRGNDKEGDRGIKFHMDPAMLEQLQNAPGFVPVIISIEPLNDLKSFLGVNVLDSR